MTSIRDQQIVTRATSGAAQGKEVSAQIGQSTAAGALPVTFKIDGQDLTLTFKSAAAYRSFLNDNLGALTPRVLARLVDNPPTLNDVQRGGLDAVRYSSDIVETTGGDPAAWHYKQETEAIHGMRTPTATFNPISAASRREAPATDRTAEPPTPEGEPVDAAPAPNADASSGARGLPNPQDVRDAITWSQGVTTVGRLAIPGNDDAAIEFGSQFGQRMQTLERAAAAGHSGAGAALEQMKEQLSGALAKEIGGEGEGNARTVAAFLSGVAESGGKRLAGELAGRAGMSDDLGRQLAGTADKLSGWDKFLDFLIEFFTLSLADTDTFNGPAQLRDGDGEPIALGTDPDFARGFASVEGAPKRLADALRGGHTVEGDEQALLHLASAMLTDDTVLVSESDRTALSSAVTSQLDELGLSDQLEYVRSLSGNAGQRRYAAELLNNISIPEHTSAEDRIAFARTALELTKARSGDPPVAINDVSPALVEKAQLQLAEAVRHGASDDVAKLIGEQTDRVAGGQLAQAVLQKLGDSDQTDDFLIATLAAIPEGPERTYFAWGLVGAPQPGGNLILDRAKLDAVGNALLDGIVTDSDRETYARLVHDLATPTRGPGGTAQLEAGERQMLADAIAGQIADGVGWWADDNFVMNLHDAFKDNPDDFLRLAMADDGVMERFLGALTSGSVGDTERAAASELYMIRFIRDNPGVTTENARMAFGNSASPRYGDQANNPAGIDSAAWDRAWSLTHPRPAAAPAAPTAREPAAE